MQSKVNSLSFEETLERSATWATVNATASGNNTLIAAPGAGKRLVISALKTQRGAGVTAETVGYLQWGAGAEAAHFWFIKTNDNAPGEIVFLPVGHRWIGPENTALVLDMSAANAHIVGVQYVVETL